VTPTLAAPQPAADTAPIDPEATAIAPIESRGSTADGPAAPRPDAGRWPWVVAAAIVGFVVIMSVFCILRHQNVWSDVYDMGQEVQVHWNSAQGRWFESSVEVQNNLGDHTTFLNVFTVAVYWLVPRPETLLVFQAIVYALGAIPAWRIARVHLGSPRLAAAIAIAYLAQPAASHAVGYEFHPLVYAPLLSLLVYDMTLHRRWGYAWLTFVLLILTREDCGLTAAGVGALVAAGARRPVTGLAMVGLGLAGFLFTLTVLLPSLRGEHADTFGRYAHLGESPSDIAVTVFSRPWVLVELMFEDVRRLLLIPLLLLPWIGLGALSLAAWFGIGLTVGPGLISGAEAQYTIGYHYAFSVIPILTIGAVLGLARLRQRWAALRTHRGEWALLGVWVVVLLIASSHNVVVTSRWMMPRHDLRDELDRIATLIPEHAPLSATSKLGPQFAHRRHLTLYPSTGWPGHRFPNLDYREAHYVLIDPNQARLKPDEIVPDPDRYVLHARTPRLRLYVHHAIAPHLPPPADDLRPMIQIETSELADASP